LNEDLEKAIADSNIEIVTIPGGCTGLLQPLDTSINKRLKERIKTSYNSWLDSMQNKLANDLNKGSNMVTTKCGNIIAPTFDDIRAWFVKALREESSQKIINSFITCGITYGINELVHLNLQLEENWNTMLKNLEDEGSVEPYLDETQTKLKVLLNEEDEVLLDDEDEENQGQEEAKEGQEEVKNEGNIEESRKNEGNREERQIERKKEEKGKQKMKGTSAERSGKKSDLLKGQSKINGFFSAKT